MRIAVSARALGFPYGGVRECTRSLVGELVGPAKAAGHEITLYYFDRELCGAFPDADEVFLRAPHKFLWDHWVLPRRLRADCPDIVWFPHNVASLGYRGKYVVTVYDMLYFPLPGFRGREYGRLDTLYMRSLMPRSIRGAGRATAISRCTADDIRTVLGCAEKEIEVIPLAAGSQFRRVDDATCNAVRAGYGLDRPFILYVGSLSVRKNVSVLLDAFERVKPSVPHDLVLVGAHIHGVRHGKAVQRHDARLRYLGAVPTDDLAGLYSAADVFVFPSLYEGFGIPPLEAFACGCPVICSNTSSLPEVVGDAAMTFDPRDINALADSLQRMLKEPETRERYRKAGTERVKLFSYRRSAEQLLRVLEEAVERDEG